jgi:hypothetical protein
MNELIKNLILGINKNTLSHWNQIDDNNELFLTVKNPGGGHKKITPEDDQALRAMALDNNWHSITQLRQTEEFQENERLMSVSDETLRQRLRSTGIKNNYHAMFLTLILLIRSEATSGRNQDKTQRVA